MTSKRKARKQAQKRAKVAKQKTREAKAKRDSRYSRIFANRRVIKKLYRKEIRDIKRERKGKKARRRRRRR